MSIYQHKNLNGEIINLSPGKVLCVGRNYAEHAKELGNPVPQVPLLFLKPKTAMVDFSQPLVIPENQGACHFETEISVLIKNNLYKASAAEVAGAIWGYGVAFDLTLRDLQNNLKQQGHPWEIAKAFDGACPLSFFIEKNNFASENICVESYLNGKLAQKAQSENMLWSIKNLIQHMSQHFTLEAGDVVLTGTPAGVAALNRGDKIKLLFPQNQFVDIATSPGFETQVF